MIWSHFHFLSTFQIHHLLPNTDMKIFGRNYSVFLGSQVLLIFSRFTCLPHFHSQSSAFSPPIPWAWLRKSHSPPPTADLYNIIAHIHTGDISFGERAHDERDNLLVGGSWPTLDNSSRLNRHTWSASQPSAGTRGVWCIEPPPDQPLHRPGLDSVQVAATYAVISEPVPNYASSDVFTAWNKAQFDSQL